MLSKLKTLTGIPASEIAEHLKAPLDPRAYKEIRGGSAGAAGLTDIDTGYMVERLHQVFGPYGLGWRLEWDPEDVVITAGDRPTVAIRRAEFQYVLVDEAGNRELVVAPCTGGSTNNDLGYALKGAETSAIGNAVSKMLFQLDVYKGILSHRNAAQVLGKNGAGAQARTPDPAARPAEPQPEPQEPEPAQANGNPGAYVVTFGRHAGKPLSQLPRDYVEWLAERMTVARPDSPAAEAQAAARAYLAAQAG